LIETLTLKGGELVLDLATGNGQWEIMEGMARK